MSALLLAASDHASVGDGLVVLGDGLVVLAVCALFAVFIWAMAR